MIKHKVGDYTIFANYSLFLETGIESIDKVIGSLIKEKSIVLLKGKKSIKTIISTCMHYNGKIYDGHLKKYIDHSQINIEESFSYVLTLVSFTKHINCILTITENLINDKKDINILKSYFRRSIVLVRSNNADEKLFDFVIDCDSNAFTRNFTT